jgi:hypothetical protein
MITRKLDHSRFFVRNPSFFFQNGTCHICLGPRRLLYSVTSDVENVVVLVWLYILIAFHLQQNIFAIIRMEESKRKWHQSTIPAFLYETHHFFFRTAHVIFALFALKEFWW